MLIALCKTSVCLGGSRGLPPTPPHTGIYIPNDYGGLYTRVRYVKNTQQNFEIFYFTSAYASVTIIAHVLPEHPREQHIIEACNMLASSGEQRRQELCRHCPDHMPSYHIDPSMHMIATAIHVLRA